jgi:hypothetical protein
MSEACVAQPERPVHAASCVQLQESAMQSMNDSKDKHLRARHDEAHLDRLSKPLVCSIASQKQGESAENDDSKQVATPIVADLGLSGNMTTKRLFAHATAKLQHMVRSTCQQQEVTQPTVDARAIPALCTWKKAPEYGFVEVCSNHGAACASSSRMCSESSTSGLCAVDLRCPLHV